MEVKEKLDKYEKEKLLRFCLELSIPVPAVEATARKEDIVAKLMDFLEARHATTSELLAENEQSSEGKKRGRESTKSLSSSSVSSKASTKSKKKTKTASRKAKKKKNVHESEDESEQKEDDDEEESEEENVNSVSERPEDILRPSDDELCGAVGEILREVDISETSFTSIVERLSEMFQTDLTPMKSHILIMIRYQLVEITREENRRMITDDRDDDSEDSDDD